MLKRNQLGTGQKLSKSRSFLVIFAYYRRFIKPFSDIAKPLFKLTEKDSLFSWYENCKLSFQTLKDFLTSAPKLRYPDITLELILDTDASAFCLEVCSLKLKLKIKENKLLLILASLFLKLSVTIVWRELLTIVEGVKHLHHYLYSKNFTVRTDHGALNWLTHFKNLEVQMTRWLKVLSVYDFTIFHRPGKSHGNAINTTERVTRCVLWRVSNKTPNLQQSTFTSTMWSRMSWMNVTIQHPIFGKPLRERNWSCSN